MNNNIRTTKYKCRFVRYGQGLWVAYHGEDMQHKSIDFNSWEEVTKYVEKEFNAAQLKNPNKYDKELETYSNAEYFSLYEFVIEYKSRVLSLLLKSKINTYELLYLMVQIRKILEILPSKESFKEIRFYCNWLLHTNLNKRLYKEKLKAIKYSIQELGNRTFTHITAGTIKGQIPDYLGLNKLKEELVAFYSQELNQQRINLDWDNFSEVLCNELVGSILSFDDFLNNNDNKTLINQKKNTSESVIYSLELKYCPEKMYYEFNSKKKRYPSILITYNDRRTEIYPHLYNCVVDHQQVFC